VAASSAFPLQQKNTMTKPLLRDPPQKKMPGSSAQTTTLIESYPNLAESSPQRPKKLANLLRQ